MVSRAHPPRVKLRRPFFSPQAQVRVDKDIEQQHSDAAVRPRLRILGVDPGSLATGYGVIDRVGSEFQWVAHGVLRPTRTAVLPSRLAELMRQLSAVIAQYSPDIASVEDVFVALSPRSALVLGQARGAALAALGSAAVPLVQYAPARIKQVVAGNGRASKEQVKRMVKRILTLSCAPATDAADALAAAICHASAGPLERVRPPRPRRRVQLRDVDPRLLRWAR
jgi:crossover junction endodeoxyribonuclease RuvC